MRIMVRDCKLLLLLQVLMILFLDFLEVVQDLCYRFFISRDTLIQQQE
jgi:hypothetical protein